MITMSDKKFYYSNPEQFDKDISYLLDNAYSEVSKFKNFFEKNFAESGESSFSPTMSFFSSTENFVGVVTCRPAQDKEDLYQALAEMLYLPMSINSELFVIATDITISSCSDKDGALISDVTDALMISFVRPVGCAIYILPYKIQDNNVVWYDHASYFNKIVTDVDANTGNEYAGDLVELFYTFSSSDNSGAFSPEEVLHYFDQNGFNHKIFNPKALNDKYHLIPFA